MKVLMLTWEYPPRIIGGISRVVHDLTDKIAKKGVEVHVVTFWEKGMLEYENNYKNIYIHRVRNHNIQSYDFIQWVNHMNMVLIGYSARIVSEIGIDIIHAHDWLVSFAAITIKNTYAIPLVGTIHATEYGRNYGLHNDTQRYIHNKEWWMNFESWKIIVNSKYMKNEMIDIFKTPENKINVIKNGVDLQKFSEIDKDINFRQNFAHNNEKIVFFIGRLVKEKGVHILIDAIPKVLYYYNDVKFIISGKGPEFQNLINKVKWMNLDNKIIFTGYIDDEKLSKLYRSVDIVVFPSLYEPFGIVALEGIVADVNVIVSDTGGFSEIIQHKYDGMKSYVGSPNSLADSILFILHNPEKAKEMRKNAIEKVKKNYNWNVIAEETVEIYKEILEESEKIEWKISDIKGKINRD